MRQKLWGGFGFMLCLWLTSCIESNGSQCGDLHCGPDTVCVATGCATEPAVEACMGAALGDACLVPGLGNGLCDGAACRFTICGNGAIEVGEACDDGNVRDGDGCSATCISDERCGNGIIDRVNNEICDDTNLVAGQPVDGDGCAADCKSNERCGNGVIDRATGEQCDDRNNIDNDGCAADCRSDETCGNGFIDFRRGEQCDESLPGLSRDGCAADCRLEFSTWRDVTPFEVNIQSENAVAYDSARGRIVAVGVGNSQTLETWEFVDGIWVNRHPLHAPLGNGAIAFDSINNRMLYFGSGAQTWQYDGTDWTQLTTAIAPQPRLTSTMAFDPLRGKLVIFGGGLGGRLAPLADTWEFDVVTSTWTQALPTTIPPRRARQAMTFDSSRNAVVMFGGTTGFPSLNDTWSFNGIDWQLLVPANATAPSKRQGATMIFDPSTQKIVLFGDSNSAVDTWELDAAGWTLRNFLVHPLPGTPGMAFDAAHNRLIMFDGARHDTWEYSNGWQQVATLFDPLDRQGATMAFDPLRNRTVLFGGAVSKNLGSVMFNNAMFSDTWIYNGTTWEQEAHSIRPSPRSNSGSTFDTARNELVLFGGGYLEENLDESHLILPDDTWIYRGTWQQRITAVSPPGRLRGQFVFDSQRARTILFGGFDNLGARNDTWEFDGSTWTQITSTIIPSAAVTQAMAYDARRGRTVLLTIQDAAAAPELWEFDGAQWQRSVAPPVTALEPVMIFDANAGVIVVGVNQRWSWDGTAWRLSQAIVPATDGGPMAFNTTTSQLGMLGTRTMLVNTVETPGTQVPACNPTAVSGDAFFGCGPTMADPDCWGRCTPLCPPWTTAIDAVAMTSVAWPAACAIAHPNASRCGDGSCNPALEDQTLCPQDCAAP